MGVHDSDIYITLLLINFVRQTNPPQGLVHGRDVRRWCNVANINSSWNFEVMDVHKRVILTAQFVSNLWCWLRNEMMAASCTGTVLPSLNLFSIFYLTSIMSSLSMPKKIIGFISSYHTFSTTRQSRIWLLSGLCKLYFAAWHFTTPPIPSHSDFTWLGAKKIHSASMEKSSLWEHKLRKFLKFLYCPPQPSE